MKEIEDLIKNTARPGPTFFQLNYFVIGKEPTLQAKMHKCLQEMKDRLASIKSVDLEIEELKDANALYELDIPKEETERTIIIIRQIRRKIESNLRHIKVLQTKISTWMEEIKFLKNMYDQIAQKTELKSWDDYDVQLEYWSEKMMQEIHGRMLMNAPVDIELIKTALALPDTSPIKRQLLEHIDQQKKQITNK